MSGCEIKSNSSPMSIGSPAEDFARSKSARRAIPGLVRRSASSPFYWPIDGADAGFDPIDHTQPRLPAWLLGGCPRTRGGSRSDGRLDRESYLDPFAAIRGLPKMATVQPIADLFLTYGRVFPHGLRKTNCCRIYRPRPGLPFTKVRLDEGTETSPVDHVHAGADRYRRPLDRRAGYLETDPA